MTPHTNLDLLFRILVNARDAEHALITLRDQFEDLYGEDHPIKTRLDDILENLDISQLLYDLGYTALDYARPDGPDPAPFLNWASDTRLYGNCEDCAHRCPPPADGVLPASPGFTGCDLSPRATFAPGYGCHDFTDEDKADEEQ